MGGIKMKKVSNILIRIGRNWYTLDNIGDFDYINFSMPILVSDEDGQDYEYDYTDIDEFEKVE